MGGLIGDHRHPSKSLFVLSEVLKGGKIVSMVKQHIILPACLDIRLRVNSGTCDVTDFVILRNIKTWY